VRVLTLAVPLAHWWSTGLNPLLALLQGDGVVAGVAAVSVLFAILYWRMARAVLHAASTATRTASGPCTKSYRHRRYRRRRSHAVIIRSIFPELYMERTPMSQPNQFSLLKQRRFAPFFWTQFLGAFNDNLFKTALVVIITFDALSWTTMSPSLVTNLIPGLFILPYVLFSATAGQLADKFEKSGLTRFVKWLEVGIMCVAGIGWVTHHLWLLIAAVVGMGVHSTLFGPVKYAYLPQQLKPEELIGGNGVTEMGTFVGILMGEVLGAVLVVQQPHGLLLEAAATICVAALGWPRPTAFRCRRHRRRI
jgi:hypothetical protein